MSRISRIVVPGYPHHITQRGVRSMDVFHSEDDRCQYLQFLYEETARFGVDILAWCLMATRTKEGRGVRLAIIDKMMRLTMFTASYVLLFISFNCE